MPAREIIDAEMLGPHNDNGSVTVSLQVSGDGAETLREFLQQIASLCNSGASRRLVIKDASDEEERAIHWDFDGDGNTKIAVGD